MYLDYHVHLENGPYHKEWALKFMECAERQGVNEVGFVEHGHRFLEARHILDIPWADNYCREHTGDYVDLVMGLRDEGYPVKLGIEMDFLRGKEGDIEEFLKRYPWDFVIGSVHWDVSDDRAFAFDHLDVTWPEDQVTYIYERYFQLVKEAILSGLFDILGHIDVVKAAGQRPPRPYDSLIKEVLRVLSDTHMCLEVSSAGLRKPAKEMYPPKRFLKYAENLGIPVVTSSDAHNPEETGFMVKEMVSLLEQAGYRETVRFSQRRGDTIPL